MARIVLSSKGKPILEHENYRYSRFTRAIANHNAGIWKFLEFLQKDQKDNAVAIEQLAAGHTRIRKPLSKKYLQNQQQIKRIVENYDNYLQQDQVVQYLKAISYKIKLYSPVTEENEDD